MSIVRIRNFNDFFPFWVDIPDVWEHQPFSKAVHQKFPVRQELQADDDVVLAFWENDEVFLPNGPTLYPQVRPDYRVDLIWVGVASIPSNSPGVQAVEFGYIVLPCQSVRCQLKKIFHYVLSCT